MRPLSASELLAAWERGRTESPMDSPLTLLAPACPGSSREELARLSIGERNRRLLLLRERIFGSRVEALAECPQCGQPVEMQFAVDELLAAGSTAPARTLVWEDGAYRVEFRLPDSLDLAGAAATGDVDAARRLLRDRCLLAAWNAGEPLDIADLPDRVEAAVVEEMAAADPQADIQLALVCAACRHEWRQAFNIASFIQLELETWVRRTLREVHVLASAYGWSESEVLGLSHWRRQCYLEMVGG